MDTRGFVGVDVVQPFSHVEVAVLRQVFRHGPGVEFAWTDAGPEDVEMVDYH